MEEDSSWEALESRPEHSVNPGSAGDGLTGVIGLMRVGRGSRARETSVCAFSISHICELSGREMLHSLRN